MPVSREVVEGERLQAAAAAVGARAHAVRGGDAGEGAHGEHFACVLNACTTGQSTCSIGRVRARSRSSRGRECYLITSLRRVSNLFGRFRCRGECVFRRHLALCRECHGTGGTIRQDRGVGRKRHAVGASARRRRVEAERPVGSKTKRRCGASAKTTRFFPPSGDERLSRASRRDTEKVRDSPRCAVRISWKVARVTRGGMRSLSCACACVCAASPDSTSFFQSRPAKDTRVKEPSNLPPPFVGADLALFQGSCVS